MSLAFFPVTRRGLLPAALALLVGGCAAGGPNPPAPAAPAGIPASTVGASTVTVPEGYRWSVEPVPVPRSFARAVDNGTRTNAGDPGPDYWTQQVDYAIDVELDPATALIQGRETVTYHNSSPDDMGLLLLRLYQNLFSEGVPRTEVVPITGGMTLDRVVLDGQELSETRAPTRASYLIDGTLMGVYFDRLLPSGGSIELEVEWHFEVPPQGAPRMGRIGYDLYNIGQWYPQVAVYDDLVGWDVWPYLGTGEFYLEYGDFDVSITVPEGWLIGATGTLENPQEVLPEAVRARLDAALSGDDIVRVVSEDDLEAGTATLTDPSGKLTWRFRADEVRDFAFAASNQYIWDATHAHTPDANGDGAEEIVEVQALYRPSADSWRDAAEYIQHAVSFHAAHWHPYPWPKMSGIEGPVLGMEYPMLTFVSQSSTGREVYETLNHEIGHMWYPMMVGSNETLYPWMDEGFNTYIEAYATADYYDEPDYWHNDQNAYLMVADTDDETPIMRPSDLHGPTGTYPFEAYWKPASLLRALEVVIGHDAVWESLRAYSDTWMYRHPHPLDFFNIVERIAGRDLDWFWHPFWYETAYLDQAIEGVDTAGAGAPGGGTARVTVRDIGSAPMPVILQVTMSDGQTIRQTVPVDVWLAGAREYVAEIGLPASGTVTSVEIDPDRAFPDVDRENNTWAP